jgi:hypothetical protein
MSPHGSERRQDETRPMAGSRSKFSGDAYLAFFLDLFIRFRLFFSTRAAVPVLDVFVEDAAFGLIFFSATRFTSPIPQVPPVRDIGY